MDLALLLGAFVGGFLMFLAPCTLPILPGYIAFIGGKRIMRNALAFTIGFSVVFILLGTFAAALGGVVGPYRDLLGRLAGVVFILFGLTSLGLMRLPLLSSDSRIPLPKFLTVGRPESSFLIGVLFALGWSPCIGPILGTILLFASTSQTVLWGTALLAVFSVGLAIPFLLTAAFLERASVAIARWGAITQFFQITSGVILILFGIFIATGSLAPFTGWALQHIPIFDALLQYL